MNRFKDARMHLLVKDADGNTEAQMAYDLTKQTFESLREIGNAFNAFYERFPRVCGWISYEPIDNTENEL